MFYSVLTLKCTIGQVFIVNGALQDLCARLMYVCTYVCMKKVSVGYCNSDRQREIAIWPPKQGISGTMTDRVKIPTKNPRFSTMTSSVKMLASDCDNNGQREVAILAVK